MTKKRKYCIHCFIILGAEQDTCFSCKYTQEIPDNTIFLNPPFRLKNQYIIGRVLGQGGFAITYIAYDQNLKTRVALKEYFPVEFATRAQDGISVVPHQGKAEELFRIGKEKFIAEARMLATFRSPNIITIRQFFEAHDTAYFVMEYIEGVTLTEYIEQQGGKLNFAEAKDIILFIMDALEEVHFANTFHRDIKPDNIYITKKGLPILLDFGAARQTVSGVTSNLLAFLTPGFSPLEQYSLNGIQGPWTDIYALAATFYYMLTGQKPATPQDRLVGDDTLVPPSQMGSDIPIEEEPWLLKGLEIKWSQRPESIQAWRAMIYQTMQPKIELSTEEIEERFIQVAILPRLKDNQLSMQEEEEIYSAASIMKIPFARVHELIDAALLKTESNRFDEEGFSESASPKNTAQQAGIEAELKEKEAKLAEEALLAEERQFKAEEERALKEIELRRKEEALRRREEELKRWEEEQRRLLEEKTQAAQAAPAVTQSSQAEPTSVMEVPAGSEPEASGSGAGKKTEKPTSQEVVELEDISEEELEELLGLFGESSNPQKGKKKAPTPESSEPEPEPEPESEEPLSLDQHYAQIAAQAAQNLSVAQPLLTPRQAYPPTLTNSLGMEFVLISPIIEGEGFTLVQTYTIGPDKELQSQFSRPFYLQTTPVTQAQWQELMQNNPARYQPDPQCPVEYVSWDDCQLFIHLLNARQEATYRLPKEVEWEYACRGGSESTYYFGDAEGQLGKYAWFRKNSQGGHHPVKAKEPNALGLYDMHGNVREWLQDKYRPWPTDEFKIKQPNARVVRGGSWDAPAPRCTVAYRGGETNAKRSGNLGFRLVIDLR